MNILRPLPPAHSAEVIAAVIAAASRREEPSPSPAKTLIDALAEAGVAAARALRITEAEQIAASLLGSVDGLATRLEATTNDIRMTAYAMRAARSIDETLRDATAERRAQPSYYLRGDFMTGLEMRAATRMLRQDGEMCLEAVMISGERREVRCLDEIDELEAVACFLGRSRSTRHRVDATQMVVEAMAFQWALARRHDPHGNELSATEWAIWADDIPTFRILTGDRLDTVLGDADEVFAEQARDAAERAADERHERGRVL